MISRHQLGWGSSGREEAVQTEVQKVNPLLERGVRVGGKVPGWATFIKGSSFRNKGLGSSFVVNGAPLTVSGKGHGVINSEYQLQLPPASSLLLDFIVSIM